MSGAIPGSTLNMSDALARRQVVDSIIKQLQAPGDANIQRQTDNGEDPLTVQTFVLDDSKASNTSSGALNIQEINLPHQTIYIQDTVGTAAYIYYRPITKFPTTDQWIRLGKGDRITWPFPVNKAYIWYPSQTSLSLTAAFLKYGKIDTATVNVVTLGAGDGSTINDAPFDTTGDQPSITIGAGATLVLPANANRIVATMRVTGANVNFGGSSCSATKGIPVDANGYYTHRNTGPLYAFGPGAVIYGVEEA